MTYLDRYLLSVYLVEIMAIMAYMYLDKFYIGRVFNEYLGVWMGIN